MATGIVSIAAWQLEFPWIAKALFYLNIISFLVLIFLLSRKLIFSFDQIIKDLGYYKTGPAYFTLVAATSILGVQVYWLWGHGMYTASFWIVALILWLIISYSFFTLITISTDNPGLGKGLDGSWLISVVATQSLAVFGSNVVESLTGNVQQILTFTLLVFFCIGCMLYIILITLIFYRLIFISLQPSELEAPYWINMGAVAITTLAGSSLIPVIETGPLSVIGPFIQGFTIFFWSIGTWWIPLLIILGIWRHIRHDVPLPWTHHGYSLSYWSMVFPLGMYTVCTYEMAKVLDFPFLREIPHYFIYIAFAGWAITFFGMMDTLLRKIRETQ